MRISEGILQWKKEGRNPAPLVELMCDLQPLKPPTEELRLKEADMLADEALKMLEHPDQVPRAEQLLSVIQDDMGRVQEVAQKLRAEGRDPSQILNQLDQGLTPRVEAKHSWEARRLIDRAKQALTNR